MDGKENRRAPRTRHDSVIEIFDIEGNVAVTGRLKDFSEAGASFTAASPLVMPERFRARVRLMDRGVLDVKARVVWVRREHNAVRYGIAFDSLRSVDESGKLKGPLP